MKSGDSVSGTNSIRQLGKVDRSRDILSNVFASGGRCLQAFHFAAVDGFGYLMLAPGPRATCRRRRW